MVKKTYVCKPGDKSRVVIEDLSVGIREDATFILGFAGVGLIGPLIANTLVDQIPDIKEIGFVASDLLPPISVFYDGILKHPFRLFYSPKHNLIVGISEVPFQLSSAYNDLAKTILNWALSEDVQAKEIVVFQGIPQRGMIEEFPVYYAAEKSIPEFDDHDVKKFSKGIITGPEATVINEALTNKLDALALFTPVYQIPTPEGAAAIISILNTRYNLEINIQPLIDEGKDIKAKMLELAEKAQQYQRQQQLPQEPSEGYTQYYQ